MNVQFGTDALLSDLRLNSYSAATLAIYRDQLKPFGKWLRRQSIEDLRTVTKTQLRAYREYVHRCRLSRVTKGLRIRAVKRMYGHLVSDGLLLIDPSEELREIKNQQALPRPIPTMAEMTRLLKAPDVTTTIGIRDQAMLELLYSTGIRVQELERLNLADMDLDARTLHLRQTKNGHPRVVPFGAHAAHWLQRYLQEVRSQLIADNMGLQALFVVVGGRALRAHVVREALIAYREKAGIEKVITPHLLRHACGTHLLQQGANERVIQELLGHRSLVSTTRYTRVVPKEVKATHTRYHPGNQPPCA